MKPLAKGLIFAAAMPLLFGFGFSWRDLQRMQGPSAKAMTTLLKGQEGGEFTATALFDDTFAKIQKDYVASVDKTKLKYAGIQGMMSSLGDPHTVFLEPSDAEEFAFETRANFVGIGARLSPDPAGARVEVVFEGSPADKNGLKPGDVITRVDGVAMSGIEVTDIVSKIRGEEGTVVKLGVLRKGAPNLLNISPKRARVITPTVEGAMIPGTKMGRVAVSSFSEPTNEQFNSAIDKLEKQGTTGIVIDLRGNGGGLLETAVDMLSRYANNQVVVKMKRRDGEIRESRTYTGQVRPRNYPIVVLVNEESASASEIFAGCMRDYGIAKLVGEHTYGKASVQEIQPLRDKSGAKITIARYFLPVTPDIGRKVDEYGSYVSGGLAPDYESKLNPDAEIIFGDIKSDTQLQKAVEVLKKG